MRIFLLEKEDGRPTFASTTMRAIFRDEKTSQLVREALHLLPQLDPRRPWPEGSDLAALYAEFSDLLDLFDAISFADENFSRVVLLMVADRSLPSDFRAMLFAEHPQAIPRLAIGAPGSYLGKETTVNDPGMLKTIYSKLALEGADPGLRSVCQHLANDAQG